MPIDMMALLRQRQLEEERSRNADVGSISAENPSIRDLAQIGLINLLGGDVSNPDTRRQANALLGVMDFIPVVNDTADISSAKQAMDRNNPTDAAIYGGSALLSAIPIIGPAAAKGLRQGVGKSARRVGTTGQYVGAPRGVDTPQALGKMRQDYMDLMESGIPGRDWYHESSDWIQQVSPPGREQSTANILGVTSQGTGVDPNTGFTIKGINQRAAGEPVRTGRFPGNQSPLIEKSLDDPSGGTSFLGPKREPFARNLSVSWAPDLANTPVHDIWQGRSFGYTHPDGKPWDAGFSPQQHAFMDEESALIMDRANKQQLGGYTDWDPLRGQAASWTGAKIRSGELKPEDAAMHYGDFAPKYQANVTHEQATGVGTGQLEGLVDMPYDYRQGFQDATSWLNEKGQDAIYSSAGMLTEPSQRTVGAYKPQGGILEINPGEVGHPLVDMAEGRINPSTANLLNIGESSRAYVDVQNAGAWNKAIPDSQTKVGERSSLVFNTEKPLDANAMAELAQVAEDNGMFVVDNGTSVSLINDPWSDIGSTRTGNTLGKELKGDLGAKLQSITGSTPKRTKIETGYEDYLDAWRAGQGSGKATTQFLNKLEENPAFAEAIEPALQKKAAANIERDIRYSKELGSPIRDDIQNARKILVDKGIAGLKKALAAGAILPAVVMTVLSPAKAPSAQNDDYSM